jgi:hypothetical protein
VTTRFYFPRDWSLAQRLAHCTAQPDENGCTLWTGYKQASGYGAIRWDRKMIYVHRAAWELANGPIPTGLHVCHRCDVPPCVNVGHLFLGTNADNIADRVAKNRSNLPCLKGEEHANAKLTEAAVRAIRASTRLQREEAAIYGVDKTLIGKIRRREVWKDVP